MPPATSPDNGRGVEKRNSHSQPLPPRHRRTRLPFRESKRRGRDTPALPSEGDRNMRKLGQFAVGFLRSEDGPTAVEYAVMLALIIVVCIAAISALGSNAEATFEYVGNKVNTTSS